MADLVFLPVADKIESGSYLLYDGACGTGGMLTVAEERLQAIAQARGKVWTATMMCKNSGAKRLQKWLSAAKQTCARGSRASLLARSRRNVFQRLIGHFLSCTAKAGLRVYLVAPPIQFLGSMF